MDEISLYEHILDIRSPWFVDDVQLDTSKDVVMVVVGLEDEAGLICPECHKPSPRYDKRQRRWRHLDTCQLQTYVEADVPRIECKEHGCRTIQVPAECQHRIANGLGIKSSAIEAPVHRVSGIFCFITCICCHGQLVGLR